MGQRDRMTIDALLAEGDWLQRLAQRLVAEPHAAADAAQEALVAALEHPPEAGVPLRRWLAGVLRNVVRQGRRRDGRRSVREVSRDIPEGPEAADELAARLELHQRLIRCVRELEEPYRSTVALRYLEDLTPAEIARRQGVPTKTVYTRLERALARLRARLDSEHGGSRAAWALVLVPDPRAGAALAAGALTSATLAPVAAMGTLQWTAVAAVVTSLCFVGVHLLRPPPTPEASHPEAHVSPEPSSRGIGARPEAALPAAARTALAGESAHVSSAPNDGSLAAPQALPAAPAISGLVLALDGSPVAGAEVRYGQSFRGTGALEGPAAEHVAVSGADGAFELPSVGTSLGLFASRPGLATLLSPVVMENARAEPVRIWMAPSIAIAGRVVDPEGAPLSGVQLEVHLPAELRRLLEPGLFGRALPVWLVAADGDGEFRFDALGWAEGSELLAKASGYVDTRVELLGHSRLDLVLTMNRPTGEHPMGGVVRHGDGRPAAGAWVGWGARGTKADDEGRFGLPLPGAAALSDAVVRAVAPGYLPGEVRLADVPESRWSHLEVTLGTEALSIVGQVVDGDGAPVAGARVWTDDGVPFGTSMREIDGARYEMLFDLEAILAGGEDTFGGRSARTDASGRFALTGLLDRNYTLFAQDARTMELAGPTEARAGLGEARMVLSGAETQRRVAGRVTDYAGNAIVGAWVMVERSRRLPDGSAWSKRSEPQDALRTDAEGRFEFAALCIEGTALVVTRESPQSVRVELSSRQDLEDLHVRVPARCDLRIELDDPSRATHFELRDALGAPLSCMVQVGGVLMQSQRFTIAGGTSDVFQTDESAVELVLYRESVEVERIPLRLDPVALNRIRP